MRKVLCSILCAVMLLSLVPTVFAAEEAAGLAAFTDVKQYADGTFGDVAPSAWYAASVKTVYNKGVMDGTGAGQFAPGETMPWAQAVTIAARLHAAYHGKTVPEAEGAWYAKYLDYARDNSLLPAICPDSGEVGSAPITREGLAVLFRSVLEEKDLPAVNDQAIPDLDKVRPEYREAVSQMFASGIFTGKNGLFDPDGKATRAEVATIVARLLCPGQRVSHDSRQNPYMADQMGNFYNGGIAVELGDTAYYVNGHFDPAAEEPENLYFIYARTADGQVREVYSAGKDSISYLSVGPDGMLYFVRHTSGTVLEKWEDALQRLDLKTGEVKTVYKPSIGTSIELYLFYDGQIYTAETVFGFNTMRQIVRVTDGKPQVLVGNLGSESLYLNKTMYCFGGKLYYHELAKEDANGKDIGSDQFCALDLESGKVSSIDTESSDFAYQGSTAWILEFTNHNFPYVLKQFSLAMPELVETVRVLDGEFAKLYPNLYADGSELYFQASDAKKVWSISPSGETEVVANTTSSGYEQSAVTSQGTIIYYDETALFAMPVKVHFADGQVISYEKFLGLPYYLEGAGQLAATDNQATWEPEEPEEPGYVYCRMVRAYVPQEGGLAVEMDIVNTIDSKVRLYSILLQFADSVDDWRFDFHSEHLAAGESKVFTFVFPEEYVHGLEDMADLELDWYDIRGKAE